jgi:hypothetical protein
LGTDEVHDIVLNINAKSSDLKKYLKAKYHKEYEIKTTDKEYLLGISNGELKQKAEEFLSDVIVEGTKMPKKKEDSSQKGTPIRDQILKLIRGAKEIKIEIIDENNLTPNQRDIIRIYNGMRDKLKKDSLETCNTYEQLNNYLKRNK